MATRPSVLVVEDDAYAQRLISAVAERAGYSVTSASSGAQAEAAADSLPFDMIVVDLNLPDTQGLNLIEGLRGRPQLAEVPFLVCSGNVNMETITGAGRLGALGFMRKPIDLQEMQRRLERSYDQLTLRWNAPAPHRTFEQRQAANEALVRARSYLAQVIAFNSVQVGAADGSADGATGDAISIPGVTDIPVAAPTGLSEAGDEPEEPLTQADLLATLRIDAAAIGAPRLERLLSQMSSADPESDQYDRLIVALRVALKSLEGRVDG